MLIPKIIHQAWIGPLPPPLRLMDSWRELNPTWEYWVWRDHAKQVASAHASAPRRVRMVGSSERWINQAVLDAIPEWAGKSDVMRYEILLRYGGVYIDCDSQALRPLDGELLEPAAWATYENETACPGLVTGAFLAARPEHVLMAELVRGLPGRQLFPRATWQSVGPEYLTSVARRIGNLHVFPSNMFTPEHHTGAKGHGEVPTYGRHLWGSTLQRYGREGVKRDDRFT